MNKLLIFKSIVSILIIAVIVTGSVVAIRSITNTAKKRCDTGVWSDMYSKCITPCDMDNTRTDPTSGECNCLPGYDWNSDHSGCVPVCGPGETRCDDDTCTNGCCADGHACAGNNTCYNDINNTTKCCLRSLIYPMPCASSAATGCFGCGIKPSPSPPSPPSPPAPSPPAPCAGGTYKSICLTGPSGPTSMCCNTGMNCALCANGTTTCCASGMDCAWCTNGTPTCCDTGMNCAVCGNGTTTCCAPGSGCTGSTDGKSYGCCPEGQVLSNDGHTCCDPGMLADGLCCLTKCSGDTTCCDATKGYQCNPKTNTCAYVCGYGPSDGHVDAKHPMSKDPTPVNTVPIFCSDSSLCYTNTEGGGWLTSCQTKPDCQFNDNLYYPNIHAQADRDDKLFCNGPMDIAATTCPNSENIVYCKTGDTDPGKLRRKVSASASTSCSFSDCLSISTLRKDTVDYVNWDGTTCTWGEKASDSYPLCSAVTCPKDSGTPGEPGENTVYCCDGDTGEIQSKSFAATCSICADFDMVNPDSPDQRAACTKCNPPYGTLENNKCVCKAVATGEKVGSPSDAPTDATLRSVTLMRTGEACTDVPVPCENRTDMQVTHRGSPTGSNPCTNYSLGCMKPMCTYGRPASSTTTVGGNTGHCFAPASCAHDATGDTCETTSGDTNGCHFCNTWSDNSIDPCTHAAGDGGMLYCVWQDGADCQYTRA